MDEKLEILEKKVEKLESLELKVEKLETELVNLKSNVESLLQNGIQFKSCEEMRRANPFLKSGFFWIDPDGHQIGDDPIHVYCDMTKGIQVVSNDLLLFKDK